MHSRFSDGKCVGRDAGFLGASVVTGAEVDFADLRSFPGHNAKVSAICLPSLSRQILHFFFLV